MESSISSNLKTGRAKIQRRIGLLISVVCFLLIVNQLNWSETFIAIYQANILPLILGSLLILSSYLIQTLRWRTLLTFPQTVSFNRTFRFFLIGLMGNAVLPFRAGDILRAYLIRRAFGYGGALAISTIVIERLFDVISMLSFGGLIGLVFQLPANLTEIFFSIAVLCFSGISFIFLLAIFGDRALLYLKKLLQSYKFRAIHYCFVIFEQIVFSVRSISSIKKFFELLLFSFLIWGIVVVAIWLFIISFDPNLPFVAGALLMVTTHLGAIIPSAPASIGVYHAIAVLTLAFWHISTETAMAIAIVSHGIMVSLQIIGGAISTWIEGGIAITRISSNTAEPN